MTMYFDDIISEVNEKIRDTIEDMPRYNAEDLGLDERSGSGFVLFKDGILAPIGTRRNLEYYGGFEYVDNKSVMGDYVFYSDEYEDEGRVRDCIDRVVQKWKVD